MLYPEVNKISVHISAV